MTGISLNESWQNDIFLYFIVTVFICLRKCKYSSKVVLIKFSIDY